MTLILSVFTNKCLFFPTKWNVFLLLAIPFMFSTLGEMPWAGLKAQDIFQKIVEENTPLDLNHTSLPSKFKAIVGYGLELHEKDRLHKFSLISHWLKSEEVSFASK